VINIVNIWRKRGERPVSMDVLTEDEPLEDTEERVELERQINRDFILWTFILYCWIIPFATFLP
jgi:hypothetical protein